MEKLTQKEHDFSAKLRQSSVIDRLRQYVAWQINGSSPAAESAAIQYGPISINLDLTTLCNCACPHCVDSGIINSRSPNLTRDTVLQTIDTLTRHGLKSVILVGGGEPTIHSDFETIAAHVKGNGLQMGISTNGLRLDRVARIADIMEEKDWLRLSVDAADNETFQSSHRPKTYIALDEILENARKIKEANPQISLGYSFVIVWDGIEVNGNELTSNLTEMARAAERAAQFGFDYISFKPCLVRLPGSQREALLDHEEKKREEAVIAAIRKGLDETRDSAGGKIKILESVNLKALLSGKLNELKTQPPRCHMQYFRTVVSPLGIFHCPAFRGIDAANVGRPDGYATEAAFQETMKGLSASIAAFDAPRECREVCCFYNGTNRWLERVVGASESPHIGEPVEDDNFFL
jgi:wyosine [tRNA(Phe)-imidazoG37] synthetase (radical SAM superfamily)